jgi:Leucine-rich repeat (LRR) protein
MKSYKQFIRESKTDIDSICQNYGIMNYTINPDGSIDVDGSVILSSELLTIIPLKFGTVTRDFDCYNNKLTSLEGSPKKVGGDFDCHNNQLTSLVGCPEVIGVDINCRNNQITDFRGVPEFFEGLFYCEGNPIEEIYKLFIQEDKHITDLNLLFGLDGLSKCIRWINEFDVIQGNKVIMDRLEEVFHQLEMEIPENITFKHYEII